LKAEKSFSVLHKASTRPVMCLVWNDAEREPTPGPSLPPEDRRQGGEHEDGTRRCKLDGSFVWSRKKLFEIIVTAVLSVRLLQIDLATRDCIFSHQDAAAKTQDAAASIQDSGVSIIRELQDSVGSGKRPTKLCTHVIKPRITALPEASP